METTVETTVHQLSTGDPADHLAFLKHLYLFSANEIMMLEKCIKSHVLGTRLAYKYINRLDYFKDRQEQVSHVLINFGNLESTMDSRKHEHLNQ